MSVVLPAVKSEPTREWIRQKFLVIGSGKIGKTAWFAEGEKTFFFEFEPGLNHVSCYKLPCRSWEEFTAICAELYKALQAGHFPYDTLVIDTVDKFLDRASEYVISRAQEKFKRIEIEVISDIPEGAGWYQTANLVDLTLDKLSQFPAALVLIGHIKTVNLKDGTREYQKDTIGIGGQAGKKLLHWADHTLYFRARLRGEEIERNIRTLPTEQWEAGSRGNVVPDGLRVNHDLTESYARFRALFT